MLSSFVSNIFTVVFLVCPFIRRAVGYRNEGGGEMLVWPLSISHVRGVIPASMLPGEDVPVVVHEPSRMVVMIVRPG